MRGWEAALAAVLVALAGSAAAARATPLDLKGYVDDAGAISVLQGGPSSDAYFALQALLLAHDNGMDVAAPALRFAQWLLPRQKPDGTFDRYCRGADRLWASCQAADADDSLLAMWIRLVHLLPADVQASPGFARSLTASKAALDHLYQPSRGIYMVSPLTLHGLFMDNLEVWSLLASPRMGTAPQAAKLAAAMTQAFWDPASRRFLVSTQLEQRGRPEAFYPDAVAQVFPLMVGFPLPGDSSARYRAWMAQHRKAWLAQGVKDYPWGIVAVLAQQQGDLHSAGCWQREAAGLRHSNRWAVTDEASFQILQARGVRPAAADARCS